MVGGVISTALLFPLVIPGYMLGSWRWIRRTRATREVGFVLAVFFFAWYAVLRLDGGPQALVPVAMLVLVGGFGVGRLVYARELRARRRSN